MPLRRVRAIRRPDGHLELLEPVELPQDQEVTVTLELPDEKRPRTQGAVLPVRKLGPMKGSLTRDEIYADIV